MLGALLYLRLTSLKNFIRSHLGRLRQPKYAFGAIFAVAYFWFFFFRHGNGSVAQSLSRVAPPEPILPAIGAFLLSVVLLLMWIVPSDEPGIKFSEPEIAFLFPAPWSRRSLLRFKIAGALFSSLGQSVFFSLVFSNRGLIRGQILTAILSWWMVLALLNLHRLGSSLALARIADAGLVASRRRKIFLAGAAVVAALAALWIWRGLAGAAPAPSSNSAEWFLSVLHTAPLRWLLWPADLILAPLSASGTAEFARALGVAALIVAAHCLWVIRMETPFEEASLARAEKQASRMAEIRRTGRFRFGPAPRGGRPAPFDLARAPWPELAFLWKNLLSTSSRWFTPRVWLGAAAGLILLSSALQHQMGHAYWKAGGALAGLGMMTVIMTLFYGPLITRLDLRQDLVNADILRTYPLPGWRIMLGELLAPTAVLTGIIWLGILSWYLGLHGHHPPKLSLVWFSPPMRLVIVGCVSFLAPFIVALQLIVPNGAAILFPAMFRALRTRRAGIDQMGQRMLFGFGQIVALLFALAPPVATAAVLVFASQWLIGPAASLIFGTCAVAVVLTGEVSLGVWWLGDRFEKADLVGEARA